MAKLRRKDIDIVQILEQQSRPAVRDMRQEKAKLLQAFPCLDHCDSLLFFAHTMARHSNSGDFQAIQKLLLSRLDKGHRITVNHCTRTVDVSLRSFLYMLELSNESQPDRIMCVHHTKVVGNCIRSTTYMKFTDIKAIHETASARIIDPAFKTMHSAKRDDALRHKIQNNNLPQDKVTEYLKLVDQNIDLVVNLRMDISLTFDDITKKVTWLDVSGHMVSLQAAVM